MRKHLAEGEKASIHDLIRCLRRGCRRSGEVRVADFEIPAQVDKEWSRGCVSLLQESSALNDEIEHPLDPFVDHDTYSQAAEEARLRADAILHRWRALPRPQDPHFIEADRLFESALMDLVASFDELCAACDAVEEKKAEEHGKKAVALLESYGEKFERAGELLMGSKLLPRNRGGL